MIFIRLPTISWRIRRTSRRRSCAPSFAQLRSWSGLLFDRGTRAEKIAGKKRCRVRALCRDAGQSSAAFPERCWRVARRRHGFHREELVQTLFPYSKPVKLECAYCLSNYSRDLQCQFGRRLAVESSDLAPRTLFPNLNVHCLASLQRLSCFNSQQCVRLAQAEECVRFLPADWREISVLAFSANVMCALAIVR